MPREKKDESFEFRLQRYYNVVDISGIFVPLITALALGGFPQLFPWIKYQQLTVFLFTTMVVINVVDLLLYRAYHKKIFFHLNRYLFLIFFMYFILVSGGIHSSYLFLLLFPVMVSAVDLDPQMTRRIGIIVCSYLALLVGLNQANYFDPVTLTDLLFHLAMFIILSSYMYIIVKETLRQKYEHDEANRKLTRLIEVESLKNDFLSIAQHQLRTPLSGIRFALESLRTDASLSEDNKQVIESGLARIGDAISIINQMLMTAETGIKDLALECTDVDLSAVVHSLLEELNYVARQKEISVREHIPRSLVIHADMKRLKPALANLIDNAFKYSPHGHVDVSLRENEQKQAILEIKDSGIGISATDLEFVFNRLYRGRNAVALEPDQSGVGLYTAKRIVELHGGTIDLKSELTKGTTVTVTLPK